MKRPTSDHMVGIECDSIPHPTYMEAEWSNGMRDVIYVVKEKRKDAVLRGVVSHKIVAQFQYRRNAESCVASLEPCEVRGNGESRKSRKNCEARSS